ncbi:MAG: hypothetical protein HN955_03230 [Prolixibacteraceae bacterium]|nr:hypothetical protein [Prolixibacteraceae bacterium]
MENKNTKIIKVRFCVIFLAIAIALILPKITNATTITVPVDYPTIQQAVNAAGVGDEVYVQAGTYYEYVTINKSLTLQGEDRETTIIDGSGSGQVIYVTANDITISGLTVANGEIGIKSIPNYSINHVTIKDVIITLNQVGLNLTRSGGYLLIEDCIISNNIGVSYAHQFNNCIIRNNEIVGNSSGLSVSWGSNTLITNNNVHHNNGTSIHFDSMFNSIIEKNNIHDNGCGVEVGYVGSSNTIRNNIISHNSVGVRFHEPRVTNNRVYHNDFIDNTVQAQDDYSTNIWDNGYPSGGNYYNDYTGVDSNNDGIGDTPYTFNNNKDNYPLMQSLFNTPPVITSVFAPVDPVQIDTEITLEIEYTDNEDNVTSITIDWGDGNPPIVYSENLSTPFQKNHIYITPGIYSVTVTVIDEFDESDSKTYQYVVVYDPTAGFVTGGGWIMSPEGAFVAAPDLSGRVNFGFVSKYKKGQIKPVGNTRFHINTGNLKFKSTKYDWLIIAGAKAQFRGVGTINDSGNYGFMLSAVDAELTPGSLIDKFRIKIWDKDDGDNVIYDNNIFADETAEAATEIGGGSIVIHSVKNKSAQILQDNLVDKENIGLQVYPNPFNNKVFFEFNSQETTHARIDLFDATGRLVKTVFNNPVIKGIPYKIEFSSEINRDCYYVYRMILGEEIFNGKILHNK